MAAQNPLPPPAPACRPRHSLIEPLWAFDDSHGDIRWFLSSVASLMTVPNAATAPNLGASTKGRHEPATAVALSTVERFPRSRR